MVRSTVLLGIFFTLVIGACHRQDENSERIAKKENKRNFESRTSEKEAGFVVETIGSSYAHVRFAQLAEGRSDNAEVKEIARLIERDNQRMIRELKGFANLRGIAIPLEENQQARRKLDVIERAEDADFDVEWSRELSSRHERLIEDMESMWEKTEDEELKAWINSALPGLRTGLVKLNACHEKLTT